MKIIINIETELEPIYLECLPFEFDKLDQNKLYNALPKHLLLDILKWGCDTVIRENIFETIVLKYLNYKSIDMYYEQDGELDIQEMDYDKLKKCFE